MIGDGREVLATDGTAHAFLEPVHDAVGVEDVLAGETPDFVIVLQIDETNGACLSLVLLFLFLLFGLPASRWLVFVLLYTNTAL